MFEISVRLARQNLPTIADAVARLIQSRHIPGYHDLSDKELVERVSEWLNLQLNYLETTNSDQWRELCVETVIERAREGIRYISVTQMIEAIIEGLGQFFQTQLGALKQTEIDGQPAVKTLEKIERRLQSLKMLSVSTIIATGLKLGNKQF